MSIAINIGAGSGSGGTEFAQVILQALFNFGSDTSTSVDYVLTNQNSPAVIQKLTLASGNTTINATNCPALPMAGGVVIIPPFGNGSSITLKGIAGDTGIALSLTAPTFIPFAVAPPASFVLTAAGTVSPLLLAWV